MPNSPFFEKRVYPHGYDSGILIPEISPTGSMDKEFSIGQPALMLRKLEQNFPDRWDSDQDLDEGFESEIEDLDAKLGEFYHRNSRSFSANELNQSRWSMVVETLKPVFASNDVHYKRRASFDLGQIQFALNDISKEDSFISLVSAESTIGNYPSKIRRQKSLTTKKRPNESSRTKQRLISSVERVKRLQIPSGLFSRSIIGKQRDGKTANHSITATLSTPLLSVNCEQRVPYLFHWIDIKISDSNSESESHTFQLDLSYGNMRWTIRRTIIDFYRLHSQIAFKNLQNLNSRNLPNFPSQLHYALQKVRAYLPQKHEEHSRSFLLARLRSKRRKALEKYLYKLLDRFSSNNFVELFIFLEISYCIQNGFKGKEGFLMMGKRKLLNFSRKEAWTSIRANHIACYDSPFDPHPKEVIMFDNKFCLERLHARNPLKQHTLVLSNEYSKWNLQAESERQMLEFERDIYMFWEKSVWKSRHRFGSFSPVRFNCDAKFYIDGESYFNAVYQAILNAQNVIYIQDWWLSPEIYLQRPVSKMQSSRLDRLLKRKAEDGVLIYVMIYKEVTISLGIQSAYTKSVLTSLHRNIKVLRYPDHIPGGIYYWALHEKFVIVDENLALYGGLDICLGRWDNYSHKVGDFHEDSSREVWPGMDYSNPRIADFRNVEQYHENSVDKNITARMPWHDVSGSITGQAARDLCRHFIQRWNFVKNAKAKDRDDIKLLLPPAEASCTDKLEGSCEVQLLRSACPWSIGASLEASCCTAYQNLIENSQHYIYIENQFFISSSKNEINSQALIKNKILRSLCDRIIRAAREGKKFKVYVVIPLLPAFESDVHEATAATLRLIVHWQKITINKGESSMFGILKAAGVDPSMYISFCSLRTYGRLGEGPMLRDSPTTSPTPFLKGKMVTEQIYVHSKVMIVDDIWAIIGSANLNDRSMLGSRDAELCAVIRDKELVKSQLGGKQFMASKFAFNLRKNLFAEHLGLDVNDAILKDITSDSFFHFWNTRAQSNSMAYRNVFRCIPDNSVENWDEYRRFLDTSYPEMPEDFIVEYLSSHIKGNLVVYPLDFLKDENLSVVFPAKEYVLPAEVFV